LARKTRAANGYGTGGAQLEPPGGAAQKKSVKARSGAYGAASRMTAALMDIAHNSSDIAVGH